MQTKRWMSTLLLLACLALPLWAQPKVQTIFDYKQELALSEAQLAGIRTELKQLATSVKALKQKHSQLEQEYSQLMKSAPLDSARTKLQEISAVVVDIRLTDLQASRRINAILTPEQLQKWRTIQQKHRQPKTPS